MTMASQCALKIRGGKAVVTCLLSENASFIGNSELQLEW